MELGDPRNRKIQGLIALAISAGIHLVGLLALLSIDSCGKSPSSNEAVSDGALQERAESRAETNEVGEVQKDNGVREASSSAGLPAPPGGIGPIEPEERAHGTTNLVVQAGDTLWTIARRCQTTPAKLAEINGTNVKALSSLRIGQVLKVPAQ